LIMNICFYWLLFLHFLKCRPENLGLFALSITLLFGFISSLLHLFQILYTYDIFSILRLMLCHYFK
jgi:hypothetical protein